MIVGGDLDLSGGSTPSRLALDGIHVGGTATLDEVRVERVVLGRDHDMAFFVRQDLRVERRAGRGQRADAGRSHRSARSSWWVAPSAAGSGSDPRTATPAAAMPTARSGRI